MDFDFNNLLSKVTSKAVSSQKDELIGLYNMEVFEKNLYFQELRKFDGEIFETIKWLSIQEESHVSILEQVLSKGNIILKEPSPKLPKLGNDSNQIIEYDINNENNAVKKYKTAIANSSGELKQILSFIMSEELKHIKRLEEFVSNSK